MIGKRMFLAEYDTDSDQEQIGHKISSLVEQTGLKASECADLIERNNAVEISDAIIDGGRHVSLHGQTLSKEDYPALAEALQAMDEVRCGAWSPGKSVQCYLKSGHTGGHCGWLAIDDDLRWTDEDTADGTD